MSTLSYANLRSFISSGYQPKHTEEIDGYKLDKSLSTRTQQVYHNETTGEAVINHRGTAGIFDWINNAAWMYGGEALYKLTPRYQEAYYKQRQVEKKYGKENVITTGHSQGGLLAELVGKDSKEIITLNKATRPAFFPPKKHDNQTDIRSKCDIISAFGYYDVEIGCDSLDILKEHKSDILERKGDKMVGEGNNISSNSIEMNFSHLTPNALANMKHHIRPEGRTIDDSRFTTMPVEPKRKFMMRGRGLVAESGMSGLGMGKNPAESMIKNPQTQHAVQIPEKGLRDRVSMSGRGLTAEGHSGEGLTAEGHSGEGMCESCMRGSEKPKEKFTTLPIKIIPKKEMSGKGSQAMKDKMKKLREMRKKK
jgi:hypothetical protein